jgi:hypothetical protein
MTDSTSHYHVEFIGSNLGRDKNPLSKVDEIEDILNEQHENGFTFTNQLNLPQASGVLYVYMIFKKNVVEVPAEEESIIKRRIRKKRW